MKSFVVTQDFLQAKDLLEFPKSVVQVARGLFSFSVVDFERLINLNARRLLAREIDGRVPAIGESVPGRESVSEREGPREVLTEVIGPVGSVESRSTPGRCGSRSLFDGVVVRPEEKSDGHEVGGIEKRFGCGHRVEGVLFL